MNELNVSKVGVINDGSFIVCVNISLHPFASVTVAVYVPITSPVRF